MGLQDTTDLCFISFQPDTILHYKITDTRLVHCTVCQSTHSFHWYSLHLFTKGWLG